MGDLTAWIRKNRISDYYYAAVVLGYTATLLFSGMRPGVFASALMILVGLELLLRRELTVSSLPDVMVVIFFAYQVLSVIWLRLGGYPFSVFITEFTASVLPMIFYFAGRALGEDA